MGNNGSYCCDNSLANSEVKFEVVKQNRPIYTETNDNVSTSKTKNKFQLSQMIDNDQFILSMDQSGIYERKTNIEKVKDIAQKLHLEVISSVILPEGLILKINLYGIENSLRNQKDGYVYFGSENDKEPINDYIMKIKRPESDEKTKGRHFLIAFNPITLKYTLRDLGSGFGCFMKIKNDILLKNNCLINIGDSYIVINIEENNYINLKIFSGSGHVDNYCFCPRKEDILIGRSNECEILINDSMLSRIHCSIEYLDNKWIIRDGYFAKLKADNLRKLSTNGTWFYLAEETDIEDKMIFKANLTLFKCHIINQQKI